MFVSLIVFNAPIVLAKKITLGIVNLYIGKLKKKYSIYFFSINFLN